jgi:catechol 2,3-dioxygenase-like lactoylglutathione lyase family enzyme
MARNLGCGIEMLIYAAPGRIARNDEETPPVDDSPAWKLGDVHHVGLTVSDIERSVCFYRDVLGLKLIRRRTTDAAYLGEQTGYRGVRLEAASFELGPAGGPGLELVQYVTHAGARADAATNRAGTSHVCFWVDDIARAHDALLAQGVRFRSAPVAITSGPNHGGYVVYLFDPDDYTIELFQAPAPGSGASRG